GQRLLLGGGDGGPHPGAVERGPGGRVPAAAVREQRLPEGRAARRPGGQVGNRENPGERRADTSPKRKRGPPLLALRACDISSLVERKRAPGTLFPLNWPGAWV